MRPLLVAFLLCAVVSAQTPSFDVVSIKPNKSGSGSMSVGVRSGRFNAVNATALTLVQNAYPQQTFHIFGAPGWMTSERYDVSATITSAVTPTIDQFRSLIRAMLADRFKLAAHIETREMPVYVMTLARADGKLGPRLRRWDVDCQAVWSGAIKNPPPSSVPGIPPCGGRGGAGLHAHSGQNMEGLARSLETYLSANVLERTGLEGQWEIHLQWTPEAQRPDTPRFDGAQGEFGTLFTAIQEQLGLKLEARHAPVEVLVIDSIERPREN
jgi:uncharacterized protein (TIGR03435 family)